MRIKFSGDYKKLYGQKKAELIYVRIIKINNNTPKEFIEYDTTKSNGEKYELKNGTYLQLVFLGDLGIPFCTCRSAYPQSKIDYYANSIGRMFDIEC